MNQNTSVRKSKKEHRHNCNKKATSKKPACIYIKATSPGEYPPGMCIMLIRQSHPPGMNILEALGNTNVVATYVHVSHDG